EQEEWDRESRDTLDEFTYENKELDEKEGYCTLESEEELDIYDNTWVNEASPAIYLTLVEERLEGFTGAETLGKEEKEEGQLFFRRESHLFDVRAEKLGMTSLVIHQIDTARARPIRQHFYRTFPDEQEFLDGLKREDEGTPSNTTEEKEWLLSLTDLVDKGRKDQLLESGNANVYSDEDLESGEETTEEYNHEASDTPNLDDLYSVESPMWGESATGVEFSDSESGWGNDWLCKVKTWEDNECKVFIVEEENQCEDFMIQEEEGEPEEPIPEAVLKKLNEYRSRAPSREAFMGQLHEARKEINKKLDIEKFEEELEK
ncbi:8000_t:CDS:2, partial [Gigaspora rosea]